MKITELVPLVAGLEGSIVRVGDDAVASNSVEHGQVSGVGLVPSGDQTINDVHVVVGCDYEVGPTAAGVHFAVGCC